MTDTRPPLGRYDAHAFEGDDEATQDSSCAFCSYPKASILHHPSRVRAAAAVVRRSRMDESKTG